MSRLQYWNQRFAGWLSAASSIACSAIKIHQKFRKSIEYCASCQFRQVPKYENSVIAVQTCALRADAEVRLLSTNNNRLHIRAVCISVLFAIRAVCICVPFVYACRLYCVLFVCRAVCVCVLFVLRAVCIACCLSMRAVGVACCLCVRIFHTRKLRKSGSGRCGKSRFSAISPKRNTRGRLLELFPGSC